MSAIIIIFMIIAIIFALSSLTYVTVEVVLEITGKKAEKEEVKPQVVYVPAPMPAEPQPEQMPDIVDQIDAEEADQMISDSLAMKKANYESGAGHGKQGIVNIGVLNDKFSSDEIITIAALKAKGIVPKNIGRIKILADGVLSKPLTIKSESYSIQAIKMIELTGGTVIILKD